MTTNSLRSLLAEPRPGQPPERVWRDWLLVAAVLATAALEIGLRADFHLAPTPVVFVALLIGALLWRRTAPLATVAVMFGALALATVVELVGMGPALPSTLAWVLVLPYSLLRWGSGREAGSGLALLLITATLDVLADFTGALEAGLGVAILLLPAALGASVRYWANARLQTFEQVKLHERQQLARDLHDTVAHHVSAIAVQAQAGRAVAATDPARAVETLGVIEQTARQTLDEMRSVVGVLRGGAVADVLPQRGVADLQRLADTTAGPRVALRMAGKLDDAGPALDAALYRLAQEALTNACRHARRVDRIEIAVVGEDDRVVLTVTDDGDTRTSEPPAWGFGLTGMRERATLLGGTFDAGPHPDGGWQVRAILPRPGVRT